MQPREHQVEGAKWALETLRQYGLAYLGWKERTGKTLTALLTIENSTAKTCLIVTKAKALPGWKDTLAKWPHTTQFILINYESIHKVEGTFDAIILDEAHHAIAAIEKPSLTWKKVAKFTQGKAILYLSATPYAETIGQLYHQFKLSTWSPFRTWSTYYSFHAEFGIPKTVYTSYGPKLDRSVFRIKDVIDKVEHLFNWKTRADVGIEQEPTVNIVKVPLSKSAQDLIKEWTTNRCITVGEFQIVGDSDSKMRQVHYQIEGSTIKVDDKRSINLDERDKINYMKTAYAKDIAIMAHFIQERELLQTEFPEALILSSDGHAEGVDLSHIEKLVVYSMSFKTSKHTQRLARQANHNRTKPIVVDILVCDKPGVGLAVYEAVALKEENFTKSSYERAIR